MVVITALVELIDQFRQNRCCEHPYSSSATMRFFVRKPSQSRSTWAMGRKETCEEIAWRKVESAGPLSTSPICLVYLQICKLFPTARKAEEMALRVGMWQWSSGFSQSQWLCMKTSCLGQAQHVSPVPSVQTVLQD